MAAKLLGIKSSSRNIWNFFRNEYGKRGLPPSRPHSNLASAAIMQLLKLSTTCERLTSDKFTQLFQS